MLAVHFQLTNRPAQLFVLMIAAAQLAGYGLTQAIAGGSATVQVTPVRASGLPGGQWEIGPGPNEITLFGGDQQVEFEVRVAGFDGSGTGQVLLGAQQATINCSTLPADAFVLDELCEAFGTAFCTGVDDDRPDYLFANVPSVPACNTPNDCQDAIPFGPACGSVAIQGGAEDTGGSMYAYTFAIDVLLTTEGSFTVQLESDPNYTFLRDDNNTLMDMTLIPGTVTIAPENQCPCDDGNICTDDQCIDGLCYFEPNHDAAFCCQPDNGSLTLIDDANDCTEDICDHETGQVTHKAPASFDLCADAIGSRALGISPPCGTGGTCDDMSLYGLLISLQVNDGESSALIDFGYVQPGGNIGQEPFYDTPANWGTIQIDGGLIRPSSTYVITLLTPTNTADALVLVGATQVTTLNYGDVDENGFCNFSDILLGVLAFQGNPAVQTILADTQPCTPNEIINLADVQWSVLCFQGVEYEMVCSTGTCCTFPDTNECGSCADNQMFGALQSECEHQSIAGTWSTEAGQCGCCGQCPGAVGCPACPADPPPCSN